MRPIYEQDSDVGGQREVIDRFCLKYGCEAIEKPRLALWDYDIVVGGRVVAIAEVKIRRSNKWDWKTYMVSERKVRLMREEAQRLSVAPLLLVQWWDAWGWARLDMAPYTVRMGGRYDRADPGDVEQVALLNCSDFNDF